jgi:hypothetical protein
LGDNGRLLISIGNCSSLLGIFELMRIPLLDYVKGVKSKKKIGDLGDIG